MFLRRGVLGILTQVMRKTGSHTPLGNFSSMRGNKNFYKGRGGKKYRLALVTAASAPSAANFLVLGR